MNSLLSALIAIPAALGVVAWLAARRSALAARAVSLAATALTLAIGIALWAVGGRVATEPGAPLWEQRLTWIPQIGAEYHLAADGLSLALVLLTGVLGVCAVLCSWREIGDRVGAFHLALLWTLSGVLGVFLAYDLLLFYLFWELMLVPMYFLIGVWGHEDRVYASFKFVLYTVIGGLLMLVSILAVYWLHGRETGVYTFDYARLMDLAREYPSARLVMLGFFLGFAVKLPAVPIHGWLPDAHTEAPTAGSVLLAGLLLKTGGYGLIRFAVPLFPEAAAWWSGAACVLGVIGILYGAVLSFAQRDLKRLVAYSSVSHLGFVLLGVYCGSPLALQGAAIQMLTHGISTGALFVIAGIVQERARSRDLEALGGIWGAAPRLGAFGLLFALAALGLPGLGNFISEFLVLVGAYQTQPVLAVLAAAGLVAAPFYALRIMQKTFYGPDERGWRFADLVWHEWAALLPPAVIIVWLGLHPQPVLGLMRPALERAPPQATVTLLGGQRGAP